MKKIKLMCLFIAMFGLVSAGTVSADRGKHYNGGGKHYYSGEKHFKHHKHHYRGGRYSGRGYYSGRNHFNLGFNRGYGGYGFRLGFGGYFPQHYAYSPVVVVQQGPPPVYIQRW